LFSHRRRRKKAGRKKIPQLAFSRRNDPSSLNFDDCLVGVWRVSGGCLVGVWQVSRRFLEGVSRVCGRYLECVLRVTGWYLCDAMLGQVRTGQVRVRQVSERCLEGV